MIIEINALDTLFFRDGKPFIMGENHWTDSIFPPNMSTIYGAIRTAYFSENMEVFQKLKAEKLLNTEKDPTKKLNIKRLFYQITNGNDKDFYYSMPLDLVRLKDIPTDILEEEKESKKYEVFILKANENKYIDSLPLKYILHFDEHIETVTDGLIEEDNFYNYINGHKDDIKISRISDYVKDEPKIGIGINKRTRTSEDSKLYRIDLKRLKNLSLMVEFEGIEIKDRGFIKLGGEGKYAEYKELNEMDDILELESGEVTDRFKINLITPAIFEKGWIPKDVTEGTYTFKNDKFKIKLVVAAIGRYTLSGGYDIAKNRAKPMLKSVPAGSTYYFEVLEGNPKDISEYFHLKSISDIRREEGYGIGIVSKWEG